MPRPKVSGMSALHRRRIGAEGEGNKVEIEIKLWGNLAYHSAEARGRFSLKKSLDKGKTVQELVKDLKLPEGLEYIIAVNGRAIEAEYFLKDGDEVALYAPFSGG
jgi:molybdopterin converting factor small subunit